MISYYAKHIHRIKKKMIIVMLCL